MNRDIDGQQRPSLSNPGADHYSLESIRYRPLTPIDVGPHANVDMSTSTSNTNRKEQILLFPVPAKDILYINNLENNYNKIRITTMDGRICLTRDIDNPEDGLSIKISKLVNGLYIVQFYGAGGSIVSKVININR